MPRMIVCAKCNEQKEHYGRGMCRSCYNIWYREQPGKRESHARRMRRYRAENPERYQAIEDRRNETEKRREWRKRYNRQYYQQNAKRLKAYQRQWRRKHPKRRDDYKRAYLARKKKLPDTLTDDEWQEILDKYYHMCVYCESTEEPLIKEHWLPVSRGGGYTAENIVPACHQCNSRKGTMTGEEFLHQLDLEECAIVAFLIKEYCA